LNQQKKTWVHRLDKICAVTGALVPIGLVIGNVGFEAMIGIVGGCWLIGRFLSEDRDIPAILKHPLVIAWLCWYASMVISLLLNGPGSKGWAHDIVFVRYPLYMIAMLDVSARISLRKYLLWGLAAGVLWAAVNTISAFAMGFDLLGKPLIRYTGKLKEASRISGMAAYAAPFFLSWGLLDGDLARKKKWLLIAVAAVAFVLLLQVRGRNAIIAAVAGILFSLLFLVRKRGSVKVLLGVAAVLIIAVVLVFNLSHLWDLSSVYDRIYYWKVALSLWKDHPLVGIGISSYQDAYKEMAASGKIAPFVAPTGQVFQQPETTHAHSLILMIATCTGIIGLAAFSGLFIIAVRLIFKQVEGYRIGLISWPAVLLTLGLAGFNIFHSWYQALFGFFLILIGSRSLDKRVNTT